jgi:hypothetical protein
MWRNPIPEDLFIPLPPRDTPSIVTYSAAVIESIDRYLSDNSEYRRRSMPSVNTYVYTHAGLSLTDPRGSPLNGQPPNFVSLRAVLLILLHRRGTLHLNAWNRRFYHWLLHMFDILSEADNFEFDATQTTQPLLFLLGDFLVNAVGCDPSVRTRLQIAGLLPHFPTTDAPYTTYSNNVLRSYCQPRLVEYYLYEESRTSVEEYVVIAQMPTPCESNTHLQYPAYLSIDQGIFRNTGTSTGTRHAIANLVRLLQRSTTDTPPGIRDLIHVGAHSLCAPRLNLAVYNADRSQARFIVGLRFDSLSADGSIGRLVLRHFSTMCRELHFMHLLPLW